MAVIVPLPEEFTRVLNRLIEIAGTAKAVRSTSDTPRLGLVVSDEVYAAFINEMVAPPEPVKRGPGRPRKVVPEPAPEPVVGHLYLDLPALELAPGNEESSP